ncbi:MAG: methyltransferase [Firmicutes bacterium]|nr:methyltransferase [Bacillota bacterium]
MNHYFTRDNDGLKKDPKLIIFKINQSEYTMETDSGVFSRSGLDYGTRVLLETILPLNVKSVLDLGCGYGPIGIVLSKETKATVLMADINQRALELAKKNAIRNKIDVEVVESDEFTSINGKFDAIVTNPPIRAGKQVYYEWFEKSKDFLTESGSFYVVIQKKQGAPSAIKELEKFYPKVEILDKKSGYFVIKCRM